MNKNNENVIEQGEIEFKVAEGLPGYGKLTGSEILKRMEQGDIIIKPFNREQLNPNGYNLRIGNKLLVYKNEILDMKEENETEEIIIPEDGLLLIPGKIYLGSTVEYTETYNLVPMMEGRSSTGRLGLDIHICAGCGEVTFRGNWTLELRCVQPIRIYPNTEVCQLTYDTICGTPDIEYTGKYQDSHDVMASKLYEDFK